MATSAETADERFLDGDGVWEAAATGVLLASGAGVLLTALTKSRAASFAADFLDLGLLTVADISNKQIKE